MNHIDIAVSHTANPTGTWTIYRVPVQDDGTQGTPDHGCALNNDGTGHGPCLGDYPHIGADAHGFYVTTNEYAFFPNFVYMGAQIYAFSKAALASGAANVAMVQFDTAHSGIGGKPGFTVWPAQSSPQPVRHRQRRDRVLHELGRRPTRLSANLALCARLAREPRPTSSSGR